MTDAPVPHEVPADQVAEGPPIQLPPSISDVEPVLSVRTPIRLEYDFIPSAAAQQYLRAYASKRILGNRSPVDGAVFVPPRGVDPRNGVVADEMVDLVDTGHVGSFCITHLPIPGRKDLPVPYVSAWIHLDGADIGFLGLVAGCAAADVRIGMRVRAVWKPGAQHWEPTGQPDVPIDEAGNRDCALKQSAAGGGEDA